MLRIMLLSFFFHRYTRVTPAAGLSLNVCVCWRSAGKERPQPHLFPPLTRPFITGHGRTPGENNDTAHKDETTMEEDNLGLLGVMHGWLGSEYRVTRSPSSSPNASRHGLHKLKRGATCSLIHFFFFTEQRVEWKRFRAERFTSSPLLGQIERLC